MAIQNADQSMGGTELELQVTDRECFFVWASEEAACRLTLEHLIHRSDGALLEFFAVEGADPHHVAEMADDVSGIAEARVVRESLDGGLVEFIVSGPCVTATLADAGAVTREVRASEGTGHVIASVPAHADVRTVVERFQAQHGGSELLASREGVQPVPIGTELGLKETLAGRLTDRQVEVLRTAIYAGTSSGHEKAPPRSVPRPSASPNRRSASICVRHSGRSRRVSSPPRRVAE